MKVKIGPYKSWFGPYQLAEKLLFWWPKTKDEFGFPCDADIVHKFGEWLAHGYIKPEPQVGDIVEGGRERKKTKLHKFLLWLDEKKERKIKIHFDPWDSWSADHTLALIILPLLKQLDKTKHGAPFVDYEDAPKELLPPAGVVLESGHVDDNHFKRWDYVLGEMIFAFESTVDESWQEQFFPKDLNIQWKVLENGHREMISFLDGYDVEGMKAYEKRIQNGHTLFGKYYKCLWD